MIRSVGPNPLGDFEDSLDGGELHLGGFGIQVVAAQAND